MNTTRPASRLSAGVVAGIAAWSSYSHMVGVALGVGERPDVAYVLPLSVDGMLVVASVAMADDKGSGRKVRLSARIAFGVGVAASLAANVAHAQPTVGARIVSAWPALALLLVVELLSRRGKLAKAEQVPAASPEASQAGKGVGETDTPGEVPAAPTARRPRAAAKTTRRPAEKTRAMATALMDAEPGITRAEVARRLKVTPRRLRDVLNEAAEIPQASAESEPVAHNGARVEFADVVTS